MLPQQRQGRGPPSLAGDALSQDSSQPDDFYRQHQQHYEQHQPEPFRYGTTTPAHPPQLPSDPFVARSQTRPHPSFTAASSFSTSRPVPSLAASHTFTSGIAAVNSVTSGPRKPSNNIAQLISQYDHHLPASGPPPSGPPPPRPTSSNSRERRRRPSRATPPPLPSKPSGDYGLHGAPPSSFTSTLTTEPLQSRPPDLLVDGKADINRSRNLSQGSAELRRDQRSPRRRSEVRAVQSRTARARLAASTDPDQPLDTHLVGRAGPLLFGEVGYLGAANLDAGYGIGAHLRRGSEGNMPMAYAAGANAARSRLAVDGAPIFRNDGRTPPPRAMSATRSRGHLRVKSDVPNGSRIQPPSFPPAPRPRDYRQDSGSGGQTSYVAAEPVMPIGDDSKRRRAPSSKIPVPNGRKGSISESSSSGRSRKGSLSEDVATSGQHRTPRNTPLSQRPPARSTTPVSPRSGIPVRNFHNGYLQTTTNNTTTTNQRISAYIAATQAPKGSPTLRSSRPRQPVSTASTSQTRAKVEEKLLSHDRKQAPPQARPKPKELAGMDFSARRAMINKSVKEKDAQRLEQLRKRVAAVRQEKLAKPAEPHPSESQTSVVRSDAIDSTAQPPTASKLAQSDSVPPVPPLPQQRATEVKLQEEFVESPILGVPGSFPSYDSPPAPNARATETTHNQPGIPLRSDASTPRTEFADVDAPTDKEAEETIHLVLDDFHIEGASPSEHALSEKASTIRPEDSISVALDGQSSRLSPGEWPPQPTPERLERSAWSPDTRTHTTITTTTTSALQEQHELSKPPPILHLEVDGSSTCESRQSSSCPEWDSEEATEAFLTRMPNMQQRKMTRTAATATTTSEKHQSFSSMSDAIHSYEGTDSELEKDHVGTAIIISQPSRYSYTSFGTSEASAGQDSGPAIIAAEWNDTSSESYSQRNRSNEAVVSPNLGTSSSSVTDGLLLPEIEGTGSGLGLSIHVPSGLPPTSRPTPPSLAAPSLPPPPPPKAQNLLRDESERAQPNPAFSPSLYNSRPPSSISPAAPLPGMANKRDSYNFPIGLSPDLSTAPTSADVSSSSLLENGGITSEPAKQEDQELRKRLSRRKHLIKELLDTEAAFHQDMKVVEDIYRATTSSVDAMKDSDRKILFGNSDQIVAFSARFAESLMVAVASVYQLPKSTRLTLPRGNVPSNRNGADKSSASGSGPPTKEQDYATTVGKAFLSNLKRMERIYECYLKNHDAANRRLKALQDKPKVRIWLQECHTYASDLTQAWDLDSLLVKPTQRILKYPLLLDSLLKETPDDHPDHHDLHTAFIELRAISSRINESKKRQDLMDQMSSRKRKEAESLMPSGLARAFGRRTEKFKQQVGIVDVIDDKEYDALSQRFGGHFFSLQIVMRDIEKYMAETKAFISHFLQLTATMENFLVLQIDDDSVEKGDADPVLESKWRKLALIIREISQVALPEHISQMQKSILEPIIKLWHLHHKPQMMMQTRKDHLAEYIRYRNILERGDKMDKKTKAQGEQWTALNDTLKDELPKLYSTTKSLIEAIMIRFVSCQLNWQRTLELKIKTAVEARRHTEDLQVDLGRIVDDFLADFQIMDEQVFQLGICNGSTAAEASSYVTPSGSLSMDGSSSSKRPTLSYSKRNESVSSEVAESYNMMAMRTRSSDHSSGSMLTQDQSGHHSDLRPYDYPVTRARANSAMSSRGTHASPSLGVSHPPNAYSGRPSTSTDRVPRSPSLPRPEPQTRPSYSSTQDITSFSGGSDRFSGLFSSAMPMPDSPGDTRPPSPERSKTPPKVLFLAASLFEFNIANDRREAGYPYLRYVQGEVFDVLGQKGELWLAKNQDDPTGQVGWIWEKHFAPLSEG